MSKIDYVQTEEVEIVELLLLLNCSNPTRKLLGRFPTTGLYAGLYEFFELITQFNPLSTVPTTGRSTPLG